jgi:hypothetical protein
MRKILTICAMAASFSALAWAETWSGTLLDATCQARNAGTKACDATPTSTTFILNVNGTQYKLDNASNDRAREAMRSRADRATNPDATKSTPVNVKVTGTVKSDGHIHADLIEIQ